LYLFLTVRLKRISAYIKTQVEDKQPEFFRRPNPKIVTMSGLVNPNKITIDAKREVIKYRSLKKEFVMNMTSITCTCRYYFCYAMCSHLYAASELYNLS
jgi:hypothetical protein